jgi:Zn-dependent metalloprotease
MSATRRPHAHPVCSIIPPHILKHMARLADPKLKQLAERALSSLAASERLRGARAAVGGIAPLAMTPVGVKQRTIYDGAKLSALPGTVVRREGEGADTDPAVNEAYDGLGVTYDFFQKVYQRNSLDGRGLALDATVHHRRNFNNAFWNGLQMVFGDGDGEIFLRFTKCLDVIAHELTHGITQYEAGLEYEGQPGALNESFSDVFGALVKQFALNQTADKADWLIGEGLWAKGVKGVALRSMKAPGTAYDDPRLGKDPQPADMDHYVDTVEDNGGVHINSSIPNRAFYLTAVKFGGYAWQKAGRIWYLALKDLLSTASDFKDAANVTTSVAGSELGAAAAEIVRDAWKEVGVKPATLGVAKARMEEKVVAYSSSAKRGAARTAARARRRQQPPAH